MIIIISEEYVQLNYSYANLIHRGELYDLKNKIKPCDIAADLNKMTFKGNSL